MPPVLCYASFSHSCHVQLALEVGHAKTLFARNPKSRKGNTAARKAAALAKQVITKVHTLAADKAKENAAKKAEVCLYCNSSTSLPAAALVGIV